MAEIDFQKHLRQKSFLCWSVIAMGAAREARKDPFPEGWLDSMRDGPVGMRVTLNGVELDPEDFMRRIEEQVDRMVAQEARRQIREQFDNSLDDVQDAMRVARHAIRKAFPVDQDPEEEGEWS